MIAIIDYGMGNLRSVQKAIEAVGSSAEVTSDPDRVLGPRKSCCRAWGRSPTRWPNCGVPAWETRSARPSSRASLASESAWACSSCSIVSLEDGEYDGLGLIPGRVVRFTPRPGLKIPHMGWNTLRIRRHCPLFAGLDESPSVYFVHSYHAETDDPAAIAAEADYPDPFPAVVWRENLMACQFHPEKSQQVGLAMYANFVAL